MRTNNNFRSVCLSALLMSCMIFNIALSLLRMFSKIVQIQCTGAATGCILPSPLNRLPSPLMDPLTDNYSETNPALRLIIQFLSRMIQEKYLSSLNLAFLISCRLFFLLYSSRVRDPVRNSIFSSKSSTYSLQILRFVAQKNYDTSLQVQKH